MSVELVELKAKLTLESDAVITEKIVVYDACLLRDGLKPFLAVLVELRARQISSVSAENA